jgi:hypothetical protein
MSPYAYCANNPIIYIDPDGKTIKGAFINSEGNAELTKKASKHTQRVYRDMSKTNTGISQFKKMVESETKIKLKITKSKIDGGNTHGYTLGRGLKNGLYKSAKIVISTAKVGDRFDNASEGEKINAVGVHESVHTEASQIAKDLKESGSWETERDPIELEYTSRTEYNNGNNSKFKDSYEKSNPDAKDPYKNPKPSYNLRKNGNNNGNNSNNDTNN